MPKKVIVIGGGYGGLKFIETIKGYDVTLIDKNLYHYMQTESYNYVTGRINSADITSPLESYCRYFGVKYVNDEALYLKEKSVVCKKGEYYFDYLVIASGAEDFMPEGFKDYSYRIKNLNSAFSYKKEVLENLFEYVTKHKISTLVIGGGGQSGVELAGELALVFSEHQKEGVLKQEFNIILIEAKEELLPEMPEFFRKNAKKRLESLGVRIILGEMIKEVKDKIVLENREITYDLFIFLGGIAPGAFIKNLDFEKERGFLKVDRFLRVKENIFAIGDAAVIKDKNGNLLPPTAQIAEQSGEYVAKYLMGEKKEFNGKIVGMFCAVGGKWAVGNIGKIYFKGYLAYLIKKSITKAYSLGIKIKANSGYEKR